MTNSPKIDISAIMNKKKNSNSPKKDEFEDKIEEENLSTNNLDDIISVPEKTEKQKVEEIIPKSPRISLWSIKTSKSNEEKNEIIKDEKEEKHEDKEEELNETLNEVTDNEQKEIKNEENIAVINEEENKDSDEIENNSGMIKMTEKNIKKSTIKEKSIEEIEAEIDKKVEEETKEKFKLKEKKLKDEEDAKELFWNYKSDFKEKEVIDTINKKNEKFKEKLKKPKTRMILVIVLLLTSISVVSGLFVLDPENHSAEIYKTRILSNINNVKIKYIDKPWVAKTINIESYSFETFTQEKWFSGTNYKYKDLIYSSSLDLEAALKNEIEIEKQELAKKAAEEAEKIAKLEAERIAKEAELIAKEAELAKLEALKQEKQLIKNVLLNKFK